MSVVHCTIHGLGFVFGTVLMCLCLPVGCFILKGENYGFLKDKILEKGNGPIQEESNVIWKKCLASLEELGKRFLENQKGFGCKPRKACGGMGRFKTH